MSSRWAVLLCAVAATGLLYTRRAVGGSLPPVADPGPCAPPSNSSAPSGLRGYGRFHANDSLIGRPVPCTPDDKICFRHNLLFDPELDKCEPVGGGSELCDLRPNRTEFEHGSGRIVGSCKTYEDACPGYRMAYDGRCYRKEVLRDFLCGCGASPTRHILGGVECRGAQPSPSSVQQPEEEGRCLIPDLRFPDIERSVFFKNPLESIQGYRSRLSEYGYVLTFGDDPLLKCNSDQAACFAEERVWVEGHSGCHVLLQQGPCADDHVVALNENAAFEGRVEVMCVFVRGGCPKGERRMIFDGQCHEDRQLQIEAPGDVYMNHYGQYIMMEPGTWISLKPTAFTNGTCQIQTLGVPLPHVEKGSLNPPCGSNDENRCSLHEAESTPPKPEL